MVVVLVLVVPDPVADSGDESGADPSDIVDPVPVPVPEGDVGLPDWAKMGADISIAEMQIGINFFILYLRVIFKMTTKKVLGG